MAELRVAVEALAVAAVSATATTATPPPVAADAEDAGDAAAAEPGCAVQRLPTDMLLHIAGMLDAVSLCRLGQVDRLFRELSDANALWVSPKRVCVCCSRVR